MEDTFIQRVGLSHHIMNFMMTILSMINDMLMVATAKKFPELAQGYFQAGPQRALNTLAAFLKVQEKAGTLEVPDPEFSAEMLCGMLFGSRILRNLIAAQPVHPNRAHVQKTVDAFLKVHAP